MLPNDLPPWEAVYQQSRRWLDAGCFEATVSDLRSIIRIAQGRQGQPSAVVMDGRTLQSSCESGPRAAYDGHKRKRGSKVHMAVDTLGHLLAVHVTPADEQERAQVQRLCEEYSRPRAARYNWPGQIKAIRVNLPEARKALYSCRVAGRWREALAGCRGFAGSPGTTSDYPRCWVGCISWWLRCSCGTLPHDTRCSGKFITRAGRALAISPRYHVYISSAIRAAGHC